MPNAMDRRSTFAATTVGKRFYPRQPVRSQRINLQGAVDKYVANTGVIFATTSRVAVRVIRTDDALMSARSVCRTLGLGMSG